MVSQLGIIRETIEERVIKGIRIAVEDVGVAPKYICRGIDA